MTPKATWSLLSDQQKRDAVAAKVLAMMEAKGWGFARLRIETQLSRQTLYKILEAAEVSGATIGKLTKALAGEGCERLFTTKALESGRVLDQYRPPPKETITRHTERIAKGAQDREAEELRKGIKR